MAFNVRQMPADRAAALIGEDDVAVFSQRLETMAATSQFDLEEPDSTRLTFLFEVGEDDLLREGKWLDGVDYMSDLVFETPRDLAGKVFKRFETFADDDHTPSEALADVRWGFARFGGTCTVLSGSVRRRPWIWKRRAMWSRIPPIGNPVRSSARKLRRKVRST